MCHGVTPVCKNANVKVIRNDQTFMETLNLLEMDMASRAHEDDEKRGKQKNASLAMAALRGPAAILFISRDTCSDSIAKSFRACFNGVSHNYRAICCKVGYRTDVPL